MLIKATDLKKAAYEQGAPSFAPSLQVRCCFSCAHCWPDLKDWHCAEYGLNFGRIQDVETYFNVTSFICADFKAGAKQS